MNMKKRNWIVAPLLVAVAGCVINPVTGNRELALVSADQEIAIGEQQYAPSQQMQGGDYSLDPQLTAYVAASGRSSRRSAIAICRYEFVVLNSSVPNAWALPGGKIAVNRGLLTELSSEAELAAVLGHEIVHAAARHGALAMQRGLLLQGALLATAVAAQRDNNSGLAVGAASLGAQLITQRNGREAELESDLYGMRYMARAGYDPQAAVTLQETFVRLSRGTWRRRRQARGAVREPSAVRRARREEPRDGGDAGEGRRGRARALPSRDRDACGSARRPTRHTTKARKRSATRSRPRPSARAAGRAAAARRSAVPRLLGDIDSSEKRHDDAIEHYDDAIGRNDDFFYYHLQKGLAHRQLRQWDSATAELEASKRLLPDRRSGLRARHDRRAARRPREGARALRARRAVGRRSRRGRARRRHSPRLARESRQVPRSARRARRARPAHRGARESHARDGHGRHGRGPLCRRAGRDPRGQPALHRRSRAGRGVTLGDRARAVHERRGISGRHRRRARRRGVASHGARAAGADV